MLPSLGKPYDDEKLLKFLSELQSEIIKHDGYGITKGEAPFNPLSPHQSALVKKGWLTHSPSVNYSHGSVKLTEEGMRKLSLNKYGS